MGYFKIRNITPLLGKRHPKANSVQKIDLSSQFNKNNLSLNPDAEFVLEANFLPITLHKLRSEGLVSVLEISKDEYLTVLNENTAKSVPEQSADSKSVTQNAEKKTAVVEKKKQTASFSSEK